MRKVVPAFFNSLAYLMQDKMTLLFSFIPPALGILLYGWGGKWFYDRMRGVLNPYMPAGEGTGAAVLEWFVSGLLVIIVLIVVNFTFVLIISLIASPFNDLISARIERVAGGLLPQSMKVSLTRMMKNFGIILLNEAKKITVIIVLTLVAFTTSLTTFLLPISVLVAALLMAIQFLDYSWCRHEMTVSQISNEVRKNFIGYAVAGFGFSAVMAVPVICLFALPFGVIYFTVLRVECNEQKQITPQA